MSSPALGGKGLKLDDFSRMALVITIPQITSSTISIAVTEQFNKESLPEHILTVLQFTLTTFPLTLAVTLLVSFLLDKDLKFSEAIGIIIIAGLLSNLLSKIIPAVHHTDDIGKTFTDSTRDAKGPLVFVLFAYKLINIWWRDFGPIMFVQSLIIGGYFGYRLRITKTIKNQPFAGENIPVTNHQLQQKSPPPLPLNPLKKEPPPLQ